VNSCLYEGSVRHRRATPVRHEFRSPLFMVYLDLAELPELFDGRALWSARRPAVAWFRRSDYLGDPAVPLEQAVRDLVGERTGSRPDGPVRLLAHLRYFGHCFNPVSFYYCFDAAGERVTSVVAEVTNTPWGERHAYVMPVGGAADHGTVSLMRDSFDKSLHVSPFMGMDHVYDWRLSEPSERLMVHIESARTGGCASPGTGCASTGTGWASTGTGCASTGERRTVFDATLSLRRREITGHSLRRALVRYPFMTLRVLARIYGHAAALKLKGVPYFANPGQASA
jgi:DUF1365 family protein